MIFNQSINKKITGTLISSSLPAGIFYQIVGTKRWGCMEIEGVGT